MRRKLMSTTNHLTLGWCAAAMIVLGGWLPPMIEAPAPPTVHRKK